ncbi:MAG: DUF1732 domain-containing protein [Nitrospiraceae bacterium]|nr:DUF1732 domain-containing protein [Nitrospiraceae bacterium]
MSVSRGLLSMTGFGEASTPYPLDKYRLSAKSLNHKNLEVILNFPKEWEHLEVATRRMAASFLTRGRVEITVSRSPQQQMTSTPISAEKATAIYIELSQIKDALGLREPVTLTHILTVMTRDGNIPPPPVDPEVAMGTIGELLRKLKASREDEGQALTKVIDGLLLEINEYLRLIGLTRPKAIEETKAAFAKKISSLLQQTTILDAGKKVEEEALLYLSKKDNEEEWQRFNIHMQRFRQDMDSGGAIGRSLDFLAQEMQREISTFITKEANPLVFQPAMAIRTILTKLKEQIQNVE